MADETQNPAPQPAPEPTDEQKAQDERTKATIEAMKISNAPKEAEPATVPNLLREHRELFHEKGLDWLWIKFDDASGNEASKPSPAEGGEGLPPEPVVAEPLSNP